MTIKEQIISLFDKLSDTERGSLLQKFNYKEVSETLLIEETPILSCQYDFKVSWTKQIYELSGDFTNLKPLCIINYVLPKI